MRDWLAPLRKLKPNWNGEGAAPPNDLALDNALQVLEMVEDLVILDVDPDAVGGVAIWVERPDGRVTWISCLNSGKILSTLQPKVNREGNSVVDRS